ncbi:VRR-NUC domain-containing protein [Brevibacillus sp. HB2.2]|uniref:VRR-NUC domain-containing protein n=1 Tax=Brevibacillus sp. HB2.2 TaxID=2738846 RepID=UPI00156B20E2|nr:VRR-NUC domain-containing protein [Brevibacillus sp. HB2.2]NRS50987.1 VRR-NUC domain-containing protein [Brevibacillus sp. HB2.2]
MRESAIEKYLREQVKAAGGRAYKFVSPGNAGVPDRLVLFPKERAYFVELKAPGKKPTPLQTVQGDKLRKLGFTVEVIDSKKGVDEFIRKHGVSAS